MSLHTRLDAVLAAGLARPAYCNRASLPTGTQPSGPMNVEGGAEAEAEAEAVRRLLHIRAVTSVVVMREVSKVMNEVKAAESKRDALQVELSNATNGVRQKWADVDAKTAELASRYGIPPDKIKAWASEMFTEAFKQQPMYLMAHTAASRKRQHPKPS